MKEVTERSRHGWEYDVKRDEKINLEGVCVLDSFNLTGSNWQAHLNTLMNCWAV
jgi:uncharacterized protein (DUF4415 family)